MSKYKGIIKKGVGRGIKLDFPTANIEVPAESEEGIFIAWAFINDVKYQSLFFLGKAVTFDDDLKKGEAYILDFDENIYGKEISVEVLNKIRENKKFENKEDLVKQMMLDEQIARRYFENLLKNTDVIE